jgi:MFS transporter, putative metabolite:H+ symporter
MSLAGRQRPPDHFGDVGDRTSNPRGFILRPALFRGQCAEVKTSPSPGSAIEPALAAEPATGAPEGRGARLIARLERIPEWSLPYSFLAIIGLGYFFVFYDITDIGFGLPAIATQFHLTGSESLFLALAIGLIGYIVGSFVIGTFADRYGRLTMLLVTFGLTAVGSFGDAVATNLFLLSLWRFVTGMGVGAGLNLVSTYIGELSPAARRGRISVFTFMIGILGQAVTPFVALALVPTFAVGWRLLFVIGGAVAVVGVGLQNLLPESPRWLVTHGRLDEAETVIARMEGTARGRGNVLAPPVVSDVSLERGRFPTRYLFQSPYRLRLALFVAMWFLWYIGNYAFLGDAATLLSDHGVSIASSILYLAVGAVGYPIGAVLMLVTADRVERHFLIVGASVVWFVGMVLIGSLAGALPITAGSFLASLALGMYLQVAYTYTAESFPTRARTSGFAWSDGLGHLGGAVGALVLPALVAATSFLFGFSAVGVTGLAAGVLALLGPRSTGQRLEGVSA